MYLGKWEEFNLEHGDNHWEGRREEGGGGGHNLENVRITM